MLPFEHHEEIIRLARTNATFEIATKHEEQHLAVLVAAIEIAAERDLRPVVQQTGEGTTVTLTPKPIGNRGPEPSQLTKHIDAMKVNDTLDLTDTPITPSIRAKVFNRGIRTGRKYSIKNGKITRLE